jgi:hypothetical protein
MNTNEKLFKTIIEDPFGKGDVSIFEKCVSPDFVEHEYGINPKRRRG